MQYIKIKSPAIVIFQNFGENNTSSTYYRRELKSNKKA